MVVVFDDTVAILLQEIKKCDKVKISKEIYLFVLVCSGELLYFNKQGARVHN